MNLVIDLCLVFVTLDLCGFVLISLTVWFGVV